jgi:hypothetical protein
MSSKSGYTKELDIQGSATEEAGPQNGEWNTPKDLFRIEKK